jgi:hypothetical protein
MNAGTQTRAEYSQSMEIWRGRVSLRSPASSPKQRGACLLLKHEQVVVLLGAQHRLSGARAVEDLQECCINVLGAHAHDAVNKGDADLQQNDAADILHLDLRANLQKGERIGKRSGAPSKSARTRNE